MQYKWNSSILWTDPYREWLLSGVATTLMISGAAWIIAFSVGTFVGIARTLEAGTAKRLATIYVELFRNVPLLVQVFLLFFVLPELLPSGAGHWLKRDLPFPEATIATVALGLFSAARVAEQVRAGIESIPRSQAAAGMATGLSLFQVYRFVLLPRAFRSIIPTLTSETLNIIKNSSIALVIGVLEITAQARQIENYTFQGFEAFAASTALYLVICFLMIQIARLIEKQVKIPGASVR
jgi:glutamate/aspartate transport system permease protein